jgi:alpha-L-rhamnosidase
MVLNQILVLFAPVGDEAGWSTRDQLVNVPGQPKRFILRVVRRPVNRFPFKRRIAMFVSGDSLRSNLLACPLGIDTPTPEFSWKLLATDASIVQTAYAIQVSPTPQFSEDLVWDSGKITSDAPFGVLYAGAALESSHRYFWRVRVWDDQDTPGEWSEPAWFETAILDPAQWKAHWISSAPPSTQQDQAALYLRGSVELPADVVRGRAYVSALGWYRLFVNGQDLTGNALVPRWTPLDHLVEYQCYDVTKHFHAGLNSIGMAIGDGRYRGHLGVGSRRDVYGNRLAGFAQIELEFASGQTMTLVTDENWHAGTGRILTSDPKFGECVDLRIPDEDWLGAPQPPARFAAAQVLPKAARTLVAEEVARVQEVERLPAQRVLRAPSGKQIVDFGQNFARVARIKLSGPAGTHIRLTFSEVLTPTGELDVMAIQMSSRKPWYQRDEVILNG